MAVPAMARVAEQAVAAVSGGDHTVKEVDAFGHAVDEINGPAESHEVAGRLGGEFFAGHGHGLAAFGSTLAESETAMRKPVEAEVREAARRSLP